MKQLFCLLAIFIFIGAFWASPSFAVEKMSDASASLKNTTSYSQKDTRAVIIKDYLSKHNSDLTLHAEYIVKVADEYEIPWNLVVAISGVESTFCKRIPYKSSNCWGWNNGETYFKDYPEAIRIVSKTLKKKYIDKGMDTPEKIAPVYAPPSPSWGWKVQFFMDQIEKHPLPNLLTNTFTI